MIRVSKKLREDCERLRSIMVEMQYPRIIQDGVIGAVYSSKDQDKTLSFMKSLLAKNPTPREIVVALQPIYREDCGIH